MKVRMLVARHVQQGIDRVGRAPSQGEVEQASAAHFFLAKSEKMLGLRVPDLHSPGAVERDDRGGRRVDERFEGFADLVQRDGPLGDPPLQPLAGIGDLDERVAPCGDVDDDTRGIDRHTRHRRG